MGGSAQVDGGAAATADSAAIFAALPTAYLELLGRTREELIGRYVFDAFPPAPDAPDAAGANPLQLSFERARDTGVPDHMPLFRYEVLDRGAAR